MRCGSLRRAHHPEVPMHHLHRHRSRRHFLRACATTAAIAHPVIGMAQGLAAQTTIHYGGSAWLGHYPAYQALKSGALPAASIHLRWQTFGTSSARMSAVLSGGIDIACTGIVSGPAPLGRGSPRLSPTPPPAGLPPPPPP